MKKLFVLILTVMMIVSSFILTGCTDNDNNNNTTTSTTQKTEPENVTVTKTVTSYEVDPMTLEAGDKIERKITYKGVIKIGNTNSAVGCYSVTAGAFNDGLEAYINMVNFNGGVGGDYEKGEQGYYIEFINYDDDNRADLGATYTKKLVEEDRVFAIVGQFSESTIGATLDYIKQTGTIFFGPASGNVEMFSVEADSAKNGATIFPVRPINTVEGRYTVNCINELYPDARNIGIIFANDGEGAIFKDCVIDQLNAIDKNYKSTVVEAQNGIFDIEKLSDCDAIIVAARRINAEQIFKTLVDEKISKPVFATGNVFLSGSVEESAFYEKYDELDDADKFPIYLTNWFDVADLEGYFECILDITKTGGEVKHLTNRYAIEGWIVADVFFEGLRRIAESDKQFTTENYVEAMESKSITIKMGRTVAVDARIDYSYGFRTGTLTLGLMDLDFEQIIDLKDITSWDHNCFPDELSGFDNVRCDDKNNWGKVVDGVFTSDRGGLQLRAEGWKTYGLYSISMVPVNYNNQGVTSAICVAVYDADKASVFASKTKEDFEEVLQTNIDTFTSTTVCGYPAYKAVANGMYYVWVINTPNNKYFINFMQAEGLPDIEPIATEMMSEDNILIFK